MCSHTVCYWDGVTVIIFIIIIIIIIAVIDMLMFASA
jgi:hypothetical protein